MQTIGSFMEVLEEVFISVVELGKLGFLIQSQYIKFIIIAVIGLDGEEAFAYKNSVLFYAVQSE
jgi:hypothetical protein